MNTNANEIKNVEEVITETEEGHEELFNSSSPVKQPKPSHPAGMNPNIKDLLDKKYDLNYIDDQELFNYLKDYQIFNLDKFSFIRSIKGAYPFLGSYICQKVGIK